MSDSTFSIYYVRFIEDIVQTLLQVFNLGRLISQKYNIKDTNWKTTQKQPQTTRKLDEIDN